MITKKFEKKYLVSSENRTRVHIVKNSKIQKLILTNFYQSINYNSRNVDNSIKFVSHFVIKLSKLFNKTIVF